MHVRADLQWSIDSYDGMTLILYIVLYYWTAKKAARNISATRHWFTTPSRKSNNNLLSGDSV